MPIALVALLALFVTAGLAASRFWPQPAEPGPRLPDLSGAQLVEVRDAAGRVVLTGEFRERVDALGNTTRDATLTDRRGRRVIGEVEIDIPGPNSMTTGQELEIDVVELVPNAKHSLFVDDREVAQFTTDDRGSIEIEMHSAVTAPDSSRR